MKIKLYQTENLEWLENAVNEYLKPFADARVDLHLTTAPASPGYDNDRVTILVAIKEEE